MPNPKQSYKERVLKEFVNGCNTDNISDPPSDLDWIKDFISKALEEQMKEVKMLITKEIRIAQLEGQPTSRLTSLYNKLG